MQIAVEQGNLELVKILKQAGANAELARLTVATKLQHLKRHSASAVPSGGNSNGGNSHMASSSNSNGLLRTPEQAPARPAAASASPPSTSTSGRNSPEFSPGPAANPSSKLSPHLSSRGKVQSAPSSPFASPMPVSSLPEITAAKQDDAKGKRSLWPPGLPPTSGGSRLPNGGVPRGPGRHERRNSNSNLSKLERHSSSELNRRDVHDGDKLGSRQDSSEMGQNPAFVPPSRMHSSRSTDMLLAQ